VFYDRIRKSVHPRVVPNLLAHVLVCKERRRKGKSSRRSIVKQHPHKSPHTPVVKGAFRETGRLQVFEKFGSARNLVLPQGLPAPALARDSLDQALLLPEHMPGGAAAQLITQAKSAFDIAFIAVLVAGTAIMLLMAALIARIISRARTPEPSAAWKLVKQGLDT
jgi:hypothetical protein